MGYSIETSQDGCYPGTTVLKNKLGLTALNNAELIAVTARAAALEANPPKQPFSFDLYCNIHRQLFGDLYDWAGTVRQINLSKKGTQFHPVESLEKDGYSLFDNLCRRHEFCGYSRPRLISALTDFYNDLNMLHPFREGNGRTQRLFFTLLIRRAGYDINFSQCDSDFLMIATIYAAQGIKDHLYHFFDEQVQ